MEPLAEIAESGVVLLVGVALKLMVSTSGALRALLHLEGIVVRPAVLALLHLGVGGPAVSGSLSRVLISSRLPAHRPDSLSAASAKRLALWSSALGRGRERPAPLLGPSPRGGLSVVGRRDLPRFGSLSRVVSTISNLSSLVGISPLSGLVSQGSEGPLPRGTRCPLLSGC